MSITEEANDASSGNPPEMRVLIVGAGAVGGFLAARLADGGDDVAVLVRPARAIELRTDGLQVREGPATRTYRPRVLTAAELEPEFDLVVLAVKSDAIASAIDDVAPAVGPSTAVVPFLNGMRHIEPLVSRFGSAVLGGVLRIATALEDDGAIRVIAPTFELEVGELTRPPGRRVGAIASRFRAAGASVAIPSDIVGAMWAKWVFIASIGAATSLMRGNVGEIVAIPGGAAFSRSIVEEAGATATAAGHPLSAAALTAVEEVLGAQGSTATSSLSRDLMAGRRTEVEPVLGDLVTSADATATPTPLLALAVLALRIHNRRLDIASGA
jgi:2-dehydropantoate 2-reductase